jgi:hypothetical protein
VGELAQRPTRQLGSEARRGDRELQQHAIPIGDESVAVTPARAHRDQQEPAAEERMPRIGDLNRDGIPIDRVVEGGIN